ncbi:nucleotidyltransferase domain-containing protein [Mucilaginibacter sp. KACC 22063]|uniref:nucleotidyltransferase domain-containing protein n=1 Tax=Mucilaginibacter sp. KACC 22063 TaxID=3025666 RepID=UPI002365C7F9|nr:nucleotidyltransferase domain-containing protein [Mucilaginibacter sp. KACC 22063]WDF53810.1 hypothetical protein PQ461_12725 [Mucilaginibacter sp. KACC 22063]
MYKSHAYTAQLTEVKKDILSTLAYFDLFNYPLTQEEIFLFFGSRVQQHEISYSLSQLVTQKSIYRFGSYYTLQRNVELISKRKVGNLKAIELLQVAEKVSKVLIKFPYVRGVAVSGSLSKKCADENSDIDFFIITAKNRLWISRTFLHALKKLSFLFKKEDWFCMNYFVDEANMEIAEQNLYTAIEVVTLIPMQGDLTFNRFYTANKWTRRFLPNQIMRLSSASSLKQNIVKQVIEWSFNNKFGDMLNDFLMRVTAARWNKKTEQGKLNAHKIVMSMMAAKGYAKPDPKRFQQKLLNAHNEKVMALEQAIENA